MRSLVFPVLFSSERKVVQTTSASLTTTDIHVLCLEPPRMGARVSMALQLPDRHRPEIVVGEVSETTRADPAAPEPGFRATFVDLIPSARRRIAAAIAKSESEGRVYKRMPAQLKIHIVGDGSLDARDISAVGVFVPGLTGPERPLELALGFDDGLAATKALVVRTEEQGAGLQFVDSTRDFRLRLDRYLAE